MEDCDCTDDAYCDEDEDGGYEHDSEDYEYDDDYDGYFTDEGYCGGAGSSQDSSGDDSGTKGSTNVRTYSLYSNNKASTEKRNQQSLDYQSYKRATDIFLEWLMKEPRLDKWKCNSCETILDLAKQADKLKLYAPPDVVEALEKAIKERERYAEKYHSPSDRDTSEDVESHENHRKFAKLLRKCYRYVTGQTFDDLEDSE